MDGCKADSCSNFEAADGEPERHINLKNHRLSNGFEIDDYGKKGFAKHCYLFYLDQFCAEF